MQVPRVLYSKNGAAQRENSTITLEVPPGTPDGAYFLFPGLSDQVPGAEAGDVVVVVQEKPHKEYRRAGDHLLLTQRISLVDALTGFKVTFTDPGGRELTVEGEEGQIVKPDEVWVIRGKGMPRREGGYGHLYLRFKIDFPENLPPMGDSNAGGDMRARLADVLGQKDAGGRAPSSRSKSSSTNGYFGFFGGGGAKDAVKAQKAPKGEQDRVARTFGTTEAYDV